MIKLKNIRTLDDKVCDILLEGEDADIDGKGKLTLLPALIDSHVHFRVPGSEHKEDWKTGARAAISGGVTTVFDMPNNTPPCLNRKNFEDKKKLIDAQLKEVGIPLRYQLYLGADKNNFDEIVHLRKYIIGVKIYMGTSTGNLLVDDEASLDRIFQLGAHENIILCIHAEDETIIRENQQRYKNERDPSIHSKIRDRSASVDWHAFSLRSNLPSASL